MKSWILRIVLLEASFFFLTALQLNADDPTPDTPANKIAVIQLGQIYDGFEEYKQETRALDDKIQIAETEINRKRELLLAEVMKLKSMDSTTSEYAKLEADIGSREEALRREFLKAEKEFVALKLQLQLNAFRKIEKAAREFAMKNHIAIVLQHSANNVDVNNQTTVNQEVNKALIAFAPELDISLQVLDRLNGNNEKTAQTNNTSSVGDREDVASVAKKQPTSDGDTLSESGQSTTTKKSKKEVRLLPISGAYTDAYDSATIGPTDLLTGSSRATSSFFRLCESIDKIAKDDSIDSVVLDLSDSELDMNFAQIDEFARHLNKLKLSKKSLYAWIVTASNVHLAIAVSCDQIIMSEMGSIDMPSVSLQTIFFRDAMDMIGVSASMVRSGDLKGSVEPYLQPVMSAELRAHYTEILASLNNSVLSRIANARKLTVDNVREAQKTRMHTAKEALARGLIDQIATSSIRESMLPLLPTDSVWHTAPSSEKQSMSLLDVLGQFSMKTASKAKRTKPNTIAVLHLNGAIEEGKHAVSGAVVDGPTIELIEGLVHDKNVKGVVVRINSPGGSAVASEAIRQSLKSLSKSKPVYISMGDIATSGGYWVACIGQPIFAERETITGSIGVFAIKLSTGSFLKRIGIRVETVGLDENNSLHALDEPWSKRDMETMQRSVDDIYGKFLQITSESRGLSVDQVLQMAGGRLWTGEMAKEKMLIDEIGGLDSCLASLANKANIEAYETLHLQAAAGRQLDLLDVIGLELGNTGLFRSEIAQKIVQSIERPGFRLTGTRTILFDAFRRNKTHSTVWALMPAELSVR